jgi:hypothetical protein
VGQAQVYALGTAAMFNRSRKLEMQAVRTKPNAGLTKQHVAAVGQIVQLRKENRDLIDYAWRFYRDEWPDLMACVHCVSDQYTTTATNKQRLRELVDREQRALDGLKQLVA